MRSSIAAIKRDLPMPGSPGDERHLSVAVLGLPPAAQQQLELVVAPDERREGGRMHGLEATLNHGFAQHLPGADRIGRTKWFTMLPPISEATYQRGVGCFLFPRLQAMRN